MDLNTLQIVALLSLAGVSRRTVAALRLSGDDETVDPAFLLSALHELAAAHPRNPKAVQVASLTARDVERSMEGAVDTLQRCERSDIRVLSPTTAGFPPRLSEIPDPPMVLYVLGSVDSLRALRSVAIVGTRSPAEWAYTRSHDCARQMAQSGWLVVSGLARGCDTAAHEGAVSAGGLTAAVLAHGLDRVYPAVNKSLANAIVDSGGCLASEYPPGQKPRGYQFVERDRLQSGLSDLVLVVQTSSRGGTMKTAGFAQRQRRPIACLEPPPNEANDESWAGNVLLLNQAVATPLPGDVRSTPAMLETLTQQTRAPQARSDQSGDAAGQTTLPI